LSATLAHQAHLQIAATPEPPLTALLTDARLSVLPDRLAALASDENLLTHGRALKTCDVAGVGAADEIGSSLSWL
jgi:hypothetical protein